MPSRFTKINDSDDVIIALEDLKKGDVVDSITLLEDVKQGHKIATHDMEKGHRVIKYVLWYELLKLLKKLNNL